MKKILLCVPLLAIFAAGFFGCSQQRQWNHEQRKAMREALRSYRQMVYLDDLNDAEFVLFSDEVAGQLENSYPVYMEFVQMQGVDDTVDMVVVSTIVDELNADARNMRHIYPYNYLVAQGVLPAGLDHEQQKAFYNCFAAKVNATYATMDQFFNAILADTSDYSQLAQFQQQCANDLFDWVVEVDEQVEITDVKYDFDPETITPGVYDVTFSTEGYEYKVSTTHAFEEGEQVGLVFRPEDIHVMKKEGQW
jgi:hypothetical protein